MVLLDYKEQPTFHPHYPQRDILAYSIRLMAAENLHEWRTNPAVVNETILAAKEFLDKELARCDKRNMANKFIKRLFNNAKSFSNAKRDGVGQTTILKFLGNNWKQWMVQEALVTLKESDDGKIDRQLCGC